MNKKEYTGFAFFNDENQVLSQSYSDNSFKLIERSSSDFFRTNVLFTDEEYKHMLIFGNENSLETIDFIGLKKYPAKITTELTDEGLLLNFTFDKNKQVVKAEELNIPDDSSGSL